MIDLAQKAISSALSCDWEKASYYNQEILKSNPFDIDALNRLARAQTELGNIKKAKTLAEKVLKIDPFNAIALKALSRWKILQKTKPVTSTPTKPQTFLEEPGKTKIVSLIHLGGIQVLAGLDAGDEVEINTHSHRVCITSKDGKYIGRLPDNLSARLRKLISMGNVYNAYIKSITRSEVRIFIKEIKRSSKLANVSSFISEKINYISFTPPELIHKKEEIPSTRDDEEKEE